MAINKVKSNNRHNGYGHNGHYCVPRDGINNSTLCGTMKSGTGTDSRHCKRVESYDRVTIDGVDSLADQTVGNPWNLYQYYFS